MIDIRIICTHDAAKLAERLTRLLEAEQHRVRLTIGRQCMAELQEARDGADAVVLIWSPDARSQTYMHEWANQIAPLRLVELALTPDAPRTTRKASVIDFSTWRGERGERAQWNALNDRLRAVSRALNPPKPPSKYAAFALGMASAAAVTGAVVLRMHDTPAPLAQTNGVREEFVTADPNSGLGGPLIAVEPGSLDDDLFHATRLPRATPLHGGGDVRLARAQDLAQIDLRDETLMERISALNPLRQQPRDGE